MGNDEWMEAIDFADALCLMSQTLNDMGVKFDDLHYGGRKVGLKINFEMRIYTRKTSSWW